MIRMLFLLVLSAPIVAAYAEGPDVAETPGWVIRQPMPESRQIPESQISDGIYYLLLDRQVKVGRQQTHTYTHFVKKVLTPQGVESASEIYINFDPSYERLCLHQILVHRDRRKINQLQLEKVKLFQRESDLERRLYNGKKTAGIILEGTRPGDVIECSYTIMGRNPVFKDHYADEVDTAWSVPLSALHYRWIFTNKRPVFHKAYNCRAKIEERKLSDGVEIRYTDKDIAANLIDEDLPVWYVPYPRVQITQFKDWAEVGRWGTALYPIPGNVSPALQKRIEKLSRSGSSSEKIAKALRLVQDEIRYLGIEIGAGSYKPTVPDVTYGRKFGDCKDKSILLCTLLNKTGIHARPALVHTRLERTIAGMLPSPLLFNHVIVFIRDGGKTYWLDPTADSQKLPLDEQYLALYGKALVLENGVHDLTDTGQQVLSQPSKEIHEHFDLSQGINQPAIFTVKTIFRGREADRMRYQIKSSGLEQSTKSYLNYYASDYPSISLGQALTTETDPATDALIVKEHYQIPEFWQISDDAEYSTGVFHAKEFYSLLQLPSTRIRTMPIGLSHPQHIIYRISAQLPEYWNIESEQWHVENDALHITGSVSYSNKELNLAYTYRTKKDHVPTDRCAAYIADLKTVKDQIGYQIFWGPDESGINWLMVGATLTGLMAALGGGVVAWRYDPMPVQAAVQTHGRRDLEGFGGWLILVLVGLFVRPVAVLLGIVELFPVFSTNYWQEVEGGIRPGYTAVFKMMVAGEMAFNTVLLILLVVLLCLFFKKRTAFPRLFILVTVFQFLIVSVDTVLADFLIVEPEQESGESAGLGRHLIFAVIWCIYMVKSERVRQTFRVRRHRKSPDKLQAALSPAAAVE